MSGLRQIGYPSAYAFFRPPPSQFVLATAGGGCANTVRDTAMLAARCYDHGQCLPCWLLPLPQTVPPPFVAPVPLQAPKLGVPLAAPVRGYRCWLCLLCCHRTFAYAHTLAYWKGEGVYRAQT